VQRPFFSTYGPAIVSSDNLVLTPNVLLVDFKTTRDTFFLSGCNGTVCHLMRIADDPFAFDVTASHGSSGAH